MDGSSEPQVNFVPCVRWIKRGVAKANPEKVELTEKELEEILNETKRELDDEEKEIEAVESKEWNEKGIEEKYNMATYDDDKDKNLAGLNFGSIVACASTSKDPYITNHDDADSEADDDIIRPDDNLILVGHMSGDASVLEIYVFNEEEESLYVHHDVILPSFPLCLEWLGLEPKSQGAPGNLCAVGTMSPIIEVWDLDIIGCLESACKLGRKPNKRKGLKRVGHRDAVLDLSWNTILPHILASGSVDQTVLLWDLDNGLPATKLSSFSEKVQTLKWHPFESQMLLTGSCDRLARVFDCRTDNSFKQWRVDGEVERVIWNHFKPFDFLVSTDSGKVYYVDCRVETPSWQLEDAHSSDVTGLSLSSHCPGLLTTASIDGEIKIWDIANANSAAPPVLVLEKNPNIGAVHCLEACPDSPFVICAGGDKKSNNFGVWDLLGEHSAVQHTFSSRQLLQGKTVKFDAELQKPLLEPMDTSEATEALETLSLQHTTKNVKSSSVKKKKH